MAVTSGNELILVVFQDFTLLGKIDFTGGTDGVKEEGVPVITDRDGVINIHNNILY